MGFLKRKVIENIRKNVEEMTEHNTKKFCSECGTIVDKTSNYCHNCKHKLKKIPKKTQYYKKYCIICGERLNEHDKYCGVCGYEYPKKIEKRKICPICGEWNNNERFCHNCGHIFVGREFYNQVIRTYIPISKTCPNCDEKHEESCSYCKKCGTKLVKR